MYEIKTAVNAEKGLSASGVEKTVVIKKAVDFDKIVIIQATPICNMNCNYCYLEENDRRGKKTTVPLINEETLRHIYRVVLTSPALKDGFNLVWHAGEPMVPGVKFYEKAFSIMQEMNIGHVPVVQEMQTNGTLITQEWADFIKKNDINIGVSIDGPEFIHDKNRVYYNSKGSFRHVMRGIQILQQNNINFSVISVLTEESLSYPDEIMRFFLKEGIYKIGFNLEESEGAHRSQLNYKTELTNKYRKFFSRVIEIAHELNTPFNIREVEEMRVKLKYESSNHSSNVNVPLEIVSFDYTGNVSTFSPEILTMRHPKYGLLIFGNAKLMNIIEDIMNNKTFLKVNKEIQDGVEKCRFECPYFSVCGGGQPSNKLAEHGSFSATETVTCRLEIKENAELMLEYLENSDRNDTEKMITKSAEDVQIITLKRDS
jgi:uncharacterized protein